MACFDGTISSASLGMDVNIRFLTPQTSREPVRVVYLLHGLFANYTSWTRYTKIELYANKMGLAVLMPDVGRSFYADMRHGGRYFSFVTEELPKICGNMFNISNKREDSFIAGLSMGGYGALKCAFKYPEKYRAVAAFSSVCDIESERIEKRLSVMDELTALWGADEKERADAMHEANLSTLCADLKERMDRNGLEMPMFLTCGLNDELLPQNRALTALLTEKSIPHDYHEWEGAHDWRFWDKSAEAAMEFFNNFKTI